MTETINAIQPTSERPIGITERLLATLQILLLFTLIWPLWLLLSLLLFIPITSLKKGHHRFKKSAQLKIDFLYAFTMEIFTILSIGSRYLSAYFKRYESTKKQGRPLLLVHGYLYNSSAWIYFLKRLEKRGYASIYTINLRPHFLPLSEYAKQIEKKAQEIKAETKREDLVLIGHSMGGLVSLFYATTLAPKGSVKEVFTLGSPLSGSQLATQFGFGPNGREMRPGAPILQEIQKNMNLKKEEIHFYHAGSDADLLVSCQSALSGCGQTFRLTDLGHMQFLNSDQIVEWIDKTLQENSR